LLVPYSASYGIPRKTHIYAAGGIKREEAIRRREVLLGGAVSAAAARDGLLDESVAIYFLQASGPSDTLTLLNEPV